MCKFFSGIAFRNGDVFTSRWTDSHDELLILAGVDEKTGDECCRVEFLPGEDMADIAGYTLTVDEQREPEWFAGVRETVENKLRARISAMIVTDSTRMLIGRAAIVADGGFVQSAQHCRLWVSRGGTVREVRRGGTVKHVRSGGTVQEVLSGGSVQEVHSGGTVRHIEDDLDLQENQ